MSLEDFMSLENEVVNESSIKDEFFKVDVAARIKERQDLNTQRCFDDRFQNKGTHNPKALDRFLEHMNMSLRQVLNNPELHKAAALQCAIDSTRQGGKDEPFITKGIDARYKNIHLADLTSTNLRPMNDGQILTSREIKEQKLTKEDGLKTFDFQISGNLKGYGTSKIKGRSGGGHQDNVTREVIEFIKWANEHGKDDYIYVALLDGEGHDFEALKRIKEKDNVWIVDHIEFQKLLNTYE